MVKRAMRLPPPTSGSAVASDAGSSSSSSSFTFAPYPLLQPGATKQVKGSCVLYHDDRCVLVNDSFPKSTVHCLILPLDLSLTSLNSLHAPSPAADASTSSPGSPTADHVALLEHMCRVAEAYVTFLKAHSPKDYAARRFITGFHALPSLPQLHMHLLSMDLDSAMLKTKKHYNSFATYFFLTSDRVLDDLKANKRVTVNQATEELLRMEEQPMRCLWCGCPLKDVPTMKRHLPSCEMNKSCEGPSSLQRGTPSSSGSGSRARKGTPPTSPRTKAASGTK